MRAVSTRHGNYRLYEIKDYIFHKPTPIKEGMASIAQQYVITVLRRTGEGAKLSRRRRRGRKAISCAAASETAGRFKWSETARRSKRPLLPSNGADALMRRSNQNREVGIYCVQNFQESRVLPRCI